MAFPNLPLAPDTITQGIIVATTVLATGAAMLRAARSNDDDDNALPPVIVNPPVIAAAPQVGPQVLPDPQALAPAANAAVVAHVPPVMAIPPVVAVIVTWQMMMTAFDRIIVATGFGPLVVGPPTATYYPEKKRVVGPRGATVNEGMTDFDVYRMLVGYWNKCRIKGNQIVWEGIHLCVADAESAAIARLRRIMKYLRPDDAMLAGVETRDTVIDGSPSRTRKRKKDRQNPDPNALKTTDTYIETNESWSDVFWSISVAQLVEILAYRYGASREQARTIGIAVVMDCVCIINGIPGHQGIDRQNSVGGYGWTPVDLGYPAIDNLPATYVRRI